MKAKNVERLEKALLFLALLLILGSTLLATFASPAEKSYGNVVAEVVSVHDGDTLTVDVAAWPDIIGSHLGVRVYGVDTRELSAGGIKAKRFVQGLIPVGSKVVLSDIMRDKYFRVVARVGFDCSPDCTDLSDTLLKYKYAVPYDGGTKQPFSKEIK